MSNLLFLKISQVNILYLQYASGCLFIQLNTKSSFIVVLSAISNKGLQTSSSISSKQASVVLITNSGSLLGMMEVTKMMCGLLIKKIVQQFIK